MFARAKYALTPTTTRQRAALSACTEAMSRLQWVAVAVVAAVTASGAGAQVCRATGVQAAKVRTGTLTRLRVARASRLTARLSGLRVVSRSCVGECGRLLAPSVLPPLPGMLELPFRGCVPSFAACAVLAKLLLLQLIVVLRRRTRRRNRGA